MHALVFGGGANRPDRRMPLATRTVLQKDYQQESAIELAGGTDGGDDVVLWAAGRGADDFRGTIDNTRVFALIRRAMGL